MRMLSKVSLCGVFLAAALPPVAVAQIPVTEIVASCRQLDTVRDVESCLQGVSEARDAGRHPPFKEGVEEAIPESSVCYGMEESVDAVRSELEGLLRTSSSGFETAATPRLKTAVADMLDGVANCYMDVGAAYEAVAAQAKADAAAVVKKMTAVSRELKIVAGKARQPAP